MKQNSSSQNTKSSGDSLSHITCLPASCSAPTTMWQSQFLSLAEISPFRYQTLSSRLHHLDCHTALWLGADKQQCSS